jgi:hypothetical protein
MRRGGAACAAFAVNQRDKDRKMTTDPAEVESIVESIKPLLAGREPEIQSAVIADLLAMWLAGHRLIDPKKFSKRKVQELQRFREELLQGHIALVRTLAEHYDRKPS